VRVPKQGVVFVASVIVALAGWQVASPAAHASAGPAGASRASAHPLAFVPLRNAKSSTSFDLAFNNMDYNGGPVMPSNTDYAVLWSPAGLGAYPAPWVSGLQTFFTDLAHDSGGNQNVDSVTSQYADLTGAFANYQTTFGGVLVDTDPYPTAQCPVAAPVVQCLTDPQIQKELTRFVRGQHLATDLTHEYFLMTPPHVETCFSNDPNANPPFGACSAGIQPQSLAFFCAYHENTSLSPMLLFANDPFVSGNPLCDDGNHPNGIFDGQLIGGLSHEQNESVTDPMPNDAWTNGAGRFQGFEVGDQCDGQMGTPLGTHNGAKYNQVINGHFYWFQEEWSNELHTCRQRLTPSAHRPVASFTVAAGSGLTLDFDASGSSAPGGIAQYVWQFNDAFGAQTIEQTTPTISHTFPSAGAYSVGLTVFESNGTSTGNGGIVTTGQSGMTPGFTVAVQPPGTGKHVNFQALSSVSAQPVLTYLWQFGDGSIGSGQSPEHTYAKPGSYTVTLVMFSGVGSAFPGAGAGPVSTTTVNIG